MNAVAEARSFLFVPGDRPDRFEKAVLSGADVVILDLEDGVAPESKRMARAAVVDWVASTAHPVAVRINRVDSPEGEDDLRALEAVDRPIVVPKTESAADLARASNGGDRPVVALVETARGIRDVAAVAEGAGLVRIAFGNADLSVSLGVDPGARLALLGARNALVIASAAAGLATPIDGVTLDLDDSERLAADLAHAREIGFGAKLCVHPAQVGETNSAFLPTAGEVDWAVRVSAAPDGASRIGGQMIDAPLVGRARAIIARDMRWGRAVRT